MKDSKYRTVYVEICGVLLVLLFTYTAINKLIDHHVFSIQLISVPLIKSFREIFAWLLPIYELLIVLLLTIKPTRLLGFKLSFWTILAFTLYLGISLLTNSNLPCHCGGVISSMSWGQHIIFNLVFILFSLTGTITLKILNKRMSFSQMRHSNKIILGQNMESTFNHCKNYKT